MSDTPKTDKELSDVERCLERIIQIERDNNQLREENAKLLAKLAEKDRA